MVESNIANNSSTNHKNVHVEKSSFGCDICELSFTESSHLVRRNKVHTGVKPHTSSVCGRSFAQNRNLVVHNRTHTGEKPYTCGYCEKKFLRTNNRLTHIYEMFVSNVFKLFTIINITISHRS